MALKAGRRGVARELVDSVNGQLNLGEIGLLTADETKELFLDVLPDLFDTAPNIEVSGNPIVIDDPAAGNAECVVSFEPKQSGSGMPSPENVRPISGLTELNVVRTGKNVCSVNSGNNLVIASVKAGVTYTFSIRNRGNCGFNLRKNREAGEVVVTYEGSSDPVISVSFTADSNFDLFLNGYGVGGDTFLNSAYDYQLEIGSSATAYEAYTGETYTIDLDGREYGGSLDFKTGVLTLTKDLYVPVVSSVGYSSSAGCNYADCRSITIAENAETICNMYDQINYDDTGEDGKYKVYLDVITIYDNRFTDVATAEAILDNCQIVYPLATPTTIELTPDEVAVLTGLNVLTTNGDEIDLSYPVDVREYLIKKLNITTE